MASKARRLSPALVVFLAILCFIVGAAAGFLGAARNNFLSPVDEYAELNSHGKGGSIHTSTEISGDLQIHFLELGNYYTGDCVYIKAGDTDVLIDAGSKTSSVPTISAYLDQYVTDNKLEYVIVTHAHEDHYAGFAASTGIFDLYECEVIIDFAQPTRSRRRPCITIIFPNATPRSRQARPTTPPSTASSRTRPISSWRTGSI